MHFVSNRRAVLYFYEILHNIFLRIEKFWRKKHWTQTLLYFLGLLYVCGSQQNLEGLRAELFLNRALKSYDNKIENIIIV